MSLTSNRTWFFFPHFILSVASFLFNNYFYFIISLGLSWLRLHIEIFITSDLIFLLFLFFLSRKQRELAQAEIFGGNGALFSLHSSFAYHLEDSPPLLLHFLLLIRVFIVSFVRVSPSCFNIVPFSFTFSFSSYFLTFPFCSSCVVVSIPIAWVSIFLLYLFIHFSLWIWVHYPYLFPLVSHMHVLLPWYPLEY